MSLWTSLAATQALKMYTFPAEWPYIAEDFYRIDESDDGNFYDAPRLVPWDFLGIAMYLDRSKGGMNNLSTSLATVFGDF